MRKTASCALLFIVGLSFECSHCPPPVFAQDGYSGISSSYSGINAFAGVNVNELLGASRFYQSGYTGSRAVLALVEGTVPGISHQTMGNMTQLVYGPGVPTSPQGTHHNHPTAVAHAMSGRLVSNPTSTNYHGFGMAYNAETWAGAISTSFTPDGSYNLSWESIAVPYSTMMLTGVGGRTVDVINSSWWFTDTIGNRRDTIGVDGLASRTGKLLVNIAGNAGPGNNSVRGYGAGYNGITVGSVGPDSGAEPYSAVSSFSSRSPSSFGLATSTNSWTTISSNVARRATVDIVAPGQDLTLAWASSGSSSYGAGWWGTSFAAPLVAGGAGLVIDAGKDLFGTQESIDGRVIKAVLMNSARKLNGWNNGQSVTDGKVSTTQALDFQMGAGLMDLSAAFDQYVPAVQGGSATTTDVLGTDRGDLGNVGHVGWDLGIVDAFSSNSYYFDARLASRSRIRTTLTWFADRNPGSAADFAGAGEEHLANLDLQIFQFDNLVDRNRIRVVAESISLYNVVEHLAFSLNAGGYYGIDVRYSEALWNFTGATNARYGLAWHVVPEPTSSSLVATVVLLGLGCRYRRKGPRLPEEIPV